MVIARAETKTGKQLFILGLTSANISRLLQGEPILLTQEKHGEGVPEGWNIFLCFGEDEQKLFNQFKSLGLVGPETKVNKNPRLGISDET